MLSPCEYNDSIKRRLLQKFYKATPFFSRSMNITFCSTVLTGVAVGATDTSLGLCRILLAKRITPGGIVAENKSVCLSVG